MSPEQGMGHPLDARSDLYSLGIVLFELLTGSEPYSADTPVGMLFKHINEPLPSLRARRPELSTGIQAVVTKAAAKQPGDRYASAGDLANALAAMVSAAPPPLPALKRLSRKGPAMLPAPFAWVEIPGGRGVMATDESNVTLSIPERTYWMAKYPVTNAQYATFVEAGGYSTRRWWTAQGWNTRLTENWTQPRYWMDATLNGAEQPVVGVSWVEAVAFCQWLSEATGEKIMLPTEAQWQYAAQGDDGRTYPWGNPWDNTERCNNNVDGKGIGRTTPVRQYEGKEDSPFGVVDMAGNVWEWCLTAYETGRNELDETDIRVLRGGSWDNLITGVFRCDFRSWYAPDIWYGNRGFRLALST
jgi:formylglycine-generating enzyme required for sulfatase activity